MKTIRTAVPAFSAAAAVGLLAAGTATASADVPPVQTFRMVMITPAHPSAQLAAIAGNYCYGKGFANASAHLFIGFAPESGGTMTAMFRQITCVKSETRKAEKLNERAGDLTIPLGQ